MQRESLIFRLKLDPVQPWGEIWVSYATQLQVLICCWQFLCLVNKCNTENTIICDSQTLVLQSVRLPSSPLMFCALFFRSCWLKKMLLSDITFAQIYTMIPYYNFRHDKFLCWLSRPSITWLKTFYLIFSSSSLAYPCFCFMFRQVIKYHSIFKPQIHAEYIPKEEKEEEITH